MELGKNAAVTASIVATIQYSTAVTDIVGTAAGPMTFGGVIRSGRVTNRGSATSTSNIVFGGTSAGRIGGQIVGTAAGPMTFSGTSHGKVGSIGTAAGPVTFSGQSFGAASGITYPLVGTFTEVGGAPGVPIAAYLATRFASPPQQDDPLPPGIPNAQCVTSPDFGGPGAYTMDVNFIADFYVAAVTSDP